MFGSFLGGKYSFLFGQSELSFATRTAVIDGAIYDFVSGLRVFTCNAANET